MAILLDVRNVKKYFPLRQGLLGKQKLLKAVDNVSFQVPENTVFAIVGESGCGKSTLARIILRLLSTTEGTVLFREREIFGLEKESLKEFRRSVQIVFQDPYASLNPRMRVYSIISEPLKIHKLVKKKELTVRVAELLLSVGLTADIMNKYPHEFSGGQRQRICIARALSLSPELIVADEPLSALDVSIQAQILNLLKEIKESRRISFVFISHDLSVVHYFSDYVAVMYLGKIVELAPTEELFTNPLHPYTQLLLVSAPQILERKEHGTGDLMREEADVPSPIDIPQGCPFHPRCPKRFSPCDTIIPSLKEVKGRSVSCLLYL